MATITDVDKLRPELLGMSVAELERRRTEIDMAIAQKAREEEVKAKEALAREANKHIDAMREGVRFLKANGLLHSRLVDAMTRNGVFSSTPFLRNITAENLVPRAARPRKPRDPNAPKRPRRTRAEMRAARDAAEAQQA